MFPSPSTLVDGVVENSESDRPCESDDDGTDEQVERFSVGDAVREMRSNNAKSSSILGVRSNRRGRLFSECSGVLSVVMVRFLSLFGPRGSDEASGIIGSRQLGDGVSNKRDFGGVSDDGPGPGCRERRGPNGRGFVDFDMVYVA